MSTPRETDTQQQQLEQTHRAVTSPLGSLAVPNFRNYWFSAVSFVMGWQILRVLIAWEGYELTDSELFLGYLGGVMGIATISVNLIGGVAADRVSRLALLITTQVCATITVTVLMMLTFGEILAPWHLLAASAAIGIIQGIDQPTRTAVVPALIPDRRLLMNALAFSSSIWQGTRVFGPGVGGFLIERIGSAATFGTVTVGYGLGTLLLFFVRIPRVDRVPGNVFKELFEGITFHRPAQPLCEPNPANVRRQFLRRGVFPADAGVRAGHPGGRRDGDGLAFVGIGGGRAHRHGSCGLLGEGSMAAGDPVGLRRAVRC